MDKTTKKQIENEAVFRKYNEDVEKDLSKDLKKNKNESEELKNLKLHFFCECADESCSKRIVMTVEEYRKYHKDRKQFIVIKGHSVQSIEKIIKTKKNYSIVEKYNKPPENPAHLHTTDTNNS